MSFNFHSGLSLNHALTRESLQKIAFNTYSIWLFTRSDLKTILGPSSFFAAVNYIALAGYGIHGLQEDASSPSTVASRTALAAFWVWIHLLPFSINNQRSPCAVAEDSINKPWRPMPCGRVTPSGARALVFFLYPVAAISSLVLGGTRQSFGLLFLGTWYNEWSGADVNPLVRNLINGLGYMCFTSGALEVAYGGPLPLTNLRLAVWLATLGGIVLTTVHTQDMYDQEGDNERGRRTVPLVIGDVPARYSITVAMLFWGLFCPWLWDATWLATTACRCLALTVAVRTLAWRSVPADKRTFQFWNAWICSLYMMPLFSAAMQGH